jgi:hypothetical protein
MVVDSGLHRDVIDLHKQAKIRIEQLDIEATVSLHLKLRIDPAFVVCRHANKLTASGLLNQDAHPLEAVALSI